MHDAQTRVIGALRIALNALQDEARAGNERCQHALLDAAKLLPAPAGMKVPAPVAQLVEGNAS
jgi:hypothetical protein